MDLKLIKQMAEEGIDLDPRVVIMLVKEVEKYRDSIERMIEKMGGINA